MSRINTLDNGKLGSGTSISEAVQSGRCPTGEQGRPGRNHATALCSGRVGENIGITGVGGRKKKTRKEGKEESLKRGGRVRRGEFCGSAL